MRCERSLARSRARERDVADELYAVATGAVVAQINVREEERGRARDEYVPNVVYSCGPMRHDDHLVIPFAVSDAHTTFATVSIPALVTELRGHAPRRTRS